MDPINLCGRFLMFEACPTCGYARRADEPCGNPACRTGTNASPENVARWDAREARESAGRAERERFANIRGACFVSPT